MFTIVRRQNFKTHNKYRNKSYCIEESFEKTQGLNKCQHFSKTENLYYEFEFFQEKNVTRNDHFSEKS